MLGIDPDAPRTDHTAELVDGHTLLLITDGLVERRDAGPDEGLAALQEALRDLGETSLEELCDTLIERMLPVDGADDVAIVAVRAHPEERPRPPRPAPTACRPACPEDATAPAPASAGTGAVSWR
jgi:serine/threonine protein phosphatase PrpC